MKQVRRFFLQSAVASAAVAGCAGANRAQAASAKSFSFIVLGDLHFDRLEHHDFQWLDKHHPRDLSQIKNYSRISGQITPLVFDAVREHIVALRQSAAPPAFVLQVGDLVEGLCGNEALAIKQNSEALEFIAQARLGLPLLFTKGNHDVTGDGAKLAFEHVLLPFMEEQARSIDNNSMHTKANYTLTHLDHQFAFFDAYDHDSLEWLEAVAAKRTASRFFLVVHPPVVPYGARASWHLFSDASLASRREKLLDILGRHEAIVMGGHLHKFSALTHESKGRRFTQLAVSSIVNVVGEGPRDVLHGIESYSPDQVDLEPQHSPETVQERRKTLVNERKHVTSFEYANTAGYAVVTVTEESVEAAIHVGVQTAPFQRVRLAT